VSRSSSSKHVDVDAVKTEAFALAEDFPEPFASEAHQHEKHQLLYARSGTMFVVTGSQRWMLPPARAAWIPARTKHVVTSTTGIELRTIYFSPTLLVGVKCDEASVFEASTLAREMILHAMRWGPQSLSSTLRDSFFRSLAGLVVEWMEAGSAQTLSLPRAKSAELQQAMAFVEAHLADATVERTARAAGMSVRSLSRRFDEETGVTFRSYLQTARMLYAMELLARPNASISAAAYAVGFQSAASFTTAFAERCGVTPSEYRARASRTT
jgi:AraC-like DNA-binding protein